MNKLVVALAALFASAVLAPAAQAFDCDADDASDVAECVRSAMKVPGIRQLLPPSARPSAAIKEACDADDADDLRECLKGLKIPGASRLVPPNARPAAEIPVEKKSADRAEAAPAAASIASDRPAKRGGSDEGPLCQKYFPNVGKLVSVPCRE